MTFSILGSEFEQSFFWLPFIGFTIGLVATSIGSGGGFFFPMILIVFFHIPAPIAVATSLAAGIPLSLAGTIGHYAKGNIKLPTGLILGIAGIAGALGGAGLTRLINPDQLKTIFGIYAIVLAFFIATHAGKKKKELQDHAPSVENNNHGMGLAFGFAGGIISGTFGTSGSAPVLAGLFAMRLPVKKIIGTSVLVVLINTIAAFLSHFLIGEVNLMLVVLLTVGSVIGAIAGPRLLAEINTEKYETAIRNVFALLMLILGIIIISHSF